MVRMLDDDALVRRIFSAASAAPSIHNTQPWRFRIAGRDLIEVHADIDRMLWIADPRARALHLSCGAALFNLRMAIRASGHRPMIWPLPDPDGAPSLIASIRLAEGKPPTPGERELFEAIGLRHSSRLPYSDRPVPEAVQISLEQAAAHEATLLRILPTRQAAVVLSLVEAADRELRADPEHESELAGWVNTSTQARLGVPWRALAPRPDHAGAPVRDFGRHPAAEGSTQSFERLPKLAVLSTPRDQRADWLRGGQGLQRVLLTATLHGLATSLLYQPIELHDMHDRPGWWPWPEEPQMVVRYGYGPKTDGTNRLPLSAILADDSG